MIAILDCETTGTPADPRARAVEVGAVALDPHRDYAEVGSFTSLMFPIPFDHVEGVLPRNGIAVSAVLGARGEADVRRALYAWMAEHNVTEVFSYNRSFDETMLKRSGFELPWAGCVMRMARKAMPLAKKDPSLAASCGYLNIETGHVEHRALPDARLAAQVFAAIRRGK